MLLDEFLSLSKSYTAIPVYRVLLADTVTPVSLFQRLRKSAHYPVLLESVEGGEQLARYSFLARDPHQVLRLKDGVTYLEDRNGSRTPCTRDYYAELKFQVSRYKEPKIQGLPGFTAGAIGYTSYDTFRLTEKLPNTPPDELGIPDAVWAFYDEVFAFDHVKHRIILIKTVFLSNHDTDLKARFENAQRALDRMEELTYQPAGEESVFSVTGKAVSNKTREQFYTMVETARKHIFEGDIFQVVMSQRFSQEYSGDLFQVYRMLRVVNPSPYLFFLDFGDVTLIGSSPEVLVSVKDRKVTVLPIAGTRKRGATDEEDAALESDLRADPKELSEHVMLVDLGRNDLSRVCEPATVKVTRSQFLVKYSHVMHLVSQVEGTLSRSMDAVDALRWCFPAGTVTGAPKIRAMEIIDACEGTKRCAYAGGLGYFDYSGNMDTCITIRTMVATNGKLHVQAGGGFVAESVPENEYQESVNKAGALLRAIELAGNKTQSLPL
jgi:anthranilate synthase component 1